MATERVGPSGRLAQRPEVKPPLLSTPARAGLLLGASAAVYAVTLSAVTGWQSDTSGATAAARASGMNDVTRARAVNDRMQATVDALDAQARDLVDAYHTAADQTVANEARLDELTALVAQVRGTAAALPARIPLPVVSMHGAVGGTGTSATLARTGGSGVKAGG